MGNYCSSEPKMTMKEVKNSDRILVFVGKKIIDATEFIYFHPGGQHLIMDKRNTDISTDFYFHNSKAQKKILSNHIANLSS